MSDHRTCLTILGLDKWQNNSSLPSFTAADWCLTPAFLTAHCWQGILRSDSAKAYIIISCRIDGYFAVIISASDSLIWRSVVDIVSRAIPWSGDHVPGSLRFFLVAQTFIRANPFPHRPRVGFDQQRYMIGVGEKPEARLLLWSQDSPGGNLRHWILAPFAWKLY
jgi:hypothetical protein